MPPADLSKCLVKRAPKGRTQPACTSYPPHEAHLNSLTWKLKVLQTYWAIRLQAQPHSLKVCFKHPSTQTTFTTMSWFKLASLIWFAAGLCWQRPPQFRPLRPQVPPPQAPPIPPKALASGASPQSPPGHFWLQPPHPCRAGA